MKSYLTKSKRKTYQSTGTITDIHMGNVLEILEPSPIKLLPNVYEEQGKAKYGNSATYLHDDNANQPDSYRLSSFLQIVESKLPRNESLYKKGYNASNEDPFQNSTIDSGHNGDLEPEIYLKEICESSPTQNELHDDDNNRDCVRKVSALGYKLEKRFCANDKSVKKQNIVRRYRKNVFQRFKTKSNIPSEQSLNITESDGEEESEQHQVQDQHLDTSKLPRSESLYKKGYNANNEDPFQNSTIDSGHSGDLEPEIYLKEICESSPIKNELHDDDKNRDCVRKVSALGYILEKRFCANDKSVEKQNIVRRFRKNVFQKVKTKSNIPSEQSLNTTESDGEEESEQHQVQDQHHDTSEKSRVVNLEHESSVVNNDRHWKKGVHNFFKVQKSVESASPNVYAVVNKLLDAQSTPNSNQPKRATEWQSSSEAERWSLEDPDLFHPEEESQTSLKNSLYEPKYYLAEPNGRAIPNTPWKVRYSLYGPVFQRKPKILLKRKIIRSPRNP